MMIDKGKILITTSFFAILIFMVALYVHSVSRTMNEINDTYKEYLAQHKEYLAQHAEDITEAIKNKYDAYFDGELVDASKFDLDMYSVSINHEKQEMYITNRPQTKSTQIIPFYFPVFR